MKALDVVNQLRTVIPTLTQLFSRVLTPTSITSSGTVATATLASHGLAVGDIINIPFANTPVGIDSLNRFGTVVTVVTSADHDITFNTRKPFHTQVTLSGFNEPEFNGTFTLLSSRSRRTFTFTVPDSGPTTGTGSGQLDDPPLLSGYRGLKEITAVTANTFSFTIDTPDHLPASGNLTTHADILIARSASFDRAIETYEEQQIDSAMVFVVLGDVLASRDRNTRNDGVGAQAPGQERRQQLIMNFTLFLILPTSNHEDAGRAADSISDIFPFFTQALCAVPFDSGLAVKQQLGALFVSHGISAYNDSNSFGAATYIHEFAFQLLTDLTAADMVGLPFSRAFRDVNFDARSDIGTGIVEGRVNLDQDPV